MNGGFFMKKIELEYRFELDDNVEVKNIVVADQKEIFEHSNELLIKGKVFFEIEYLNGEIINKTVKEKDLDVSLSKDKYHLKDITFTLIDYIYKIDNNILFVILNYELKGEDVCLDKFCLLDEDDVSNKLRDYFHREYQSEIDENSIILLDPIIDEEKIKVEVKKEEDVVKDDNFLQPIPESKNDLKEEKKENSPLFEERYVTSYLYYRVRKDDTVESICEKFNITKTTLTESNKLSEFKENMLLLIKKNV